MQRAVKVTMKFATAKKGQKIAALLEAYRAAVNFYIRILWENDGGLDKITLEKLQNTRLSQRYKSQALKQALDIVAATRKSAQALDVQATMPTFSGAAILDGKFISVEEGKGSFDLVIRISVLKKGRRVTIPTRRTAVLNKWLSKPGQAYSGMCSFGRCSYPVGRVA